MKTIRIKVYPKNKTQLKSIADFLSNEGIEFELAENEEFVEFPLNSDQALVKL